MGLIQLEPTLANLTLLATASIPLYFIGLAVYNLYFHPLSKFPGPALWSISRLLWVYHNSRGELIFKVKELHDQYGPVVRVAPDELSFIESVAWREIYGGTDAAQLDRDIYIFPPENPKNLPNNIIHAGHKEHTAIRRRLAYAFSTKALEQQQPMIAKHIDSLVQQLKKQQDKPINISDWFNFAAFDTIADLALGESLGCLDNGQYHPLAKHLIGAFRAGILMSSVNRYFPLEKMKFILRRIIPKKTLNRNKQFLINLNTQVKNRLEKTGSDRPDFISYMLSEDKAGGMMTKMDIQANIAAFFIGGSESTASLLSGLLFYLLKDPIRMEKVKHEVRSNFSNQKEIDYKSVSRLPYLIACIEEGLRITTPTPFGICRRTTQPTTIAGQLVPPETSVSVPQWAAFHSAHNFKQPEDFIPERWLGAEEFVNDDRSVFQPFSVGPRNCMGKALAYNEMRLTFAHLLWSFDFELADPFFEWTQQKAFLSWSKLPLMVKVTTRSVDRVAAKSKPSVISA